MSARPASSASCDEVLGIGGVQRGRLLDQDVLACLERALGKLVVGGAGVAITTASSSGSSSTSSKFVGHARLRVARREPLAAAPVEVAEPAQLGELGEVPREVRAPVAEADQSR